MHYDYDYALRLRIRTTTTTTTTTSTSTTTTHYAYGYDYDYNYAFAFDYAFAYEFPNDLLSVQLHFRYFDPLIDCHLTVTDGPLRYEHPLPTHISPLSYVLSQFSSLPFLGSFSTLPPSLLNSRTYETLPNKVISGAPRV
ncbi:hypothetical protein C8R45DRAFT_1109707 [Mycena sanguinolenta]|nr:hypothetical protein C8R45DRAFT_1109707 [Mycena sanguinolenta]